MWHPQSLARLILDHILEILTRCRIVEVGNVKALWRQSDLVFIIGQRVPGIGVAVVC